MAQSGYTPVSLYYSNTASAAPTAGNLNYGELAINITDGKLYYKDNGGAVQIIATKAGALGTVTSVAATVPSFLSISGSPITSSGTLAITYSGTALPVANGGTGLTSVTSGYVPYGNGTSALSTSMNLQFNGTQLSVGGSGGSGKINLIGSNTPIAMFSLSGANESDIDFPNDQTLEIRTYNASGSNIIFGTNPNGGGNQERFRIGSAGQLGIAGANYGTTGQVLTSGGASAAPSWTTITSTGGTVTSVAQSFTGGIISVSGSPITTSGTLALTVAGTSGGIPYFSSASTWASSAALTQYGVVYGGGAGAAPVATAAGTTGQVLLATTSAAPSWGQVSLTAGVTGVLPIANGGTNSTATPTAGGVVYGTGTAHAISAAGTTGQVLTSNGSSAPTWTTLSSGGGLSGTQTFTTNGTFTIPSNITTVKVTVIGGGGGGGSGYATGGSNAGGGGGGAGGNLVKYLTGLTAGNTLTVTVGAAGAFGNNGNGGNGGTSSVASGTQTITTLTANGGSGGNKTTGVGGTGGTALNGGINIQGQTGGFQTVGSTGNGGTGGSSIFGFGGVGSNSSSATGVSAVGYGAGGGGGGADGFSSTSNGGSGSQGIVIFEY
jgi:hypothetical protein